MPTASKKPATSSKEKTAGKSSATNTKATGSRATVKAKSSAAEDLRELMIDSLKDIYWAEKALTKALPKMAKNAVTPKLSEAIDEHLAVTEEQVSRLESVFEALGEKAVAKKCEAMDGLIKEGEEMMKETEPGPVRDAAIISASQKIEHYEIASYGTLVAFAKTLGEDEVAAMLEETLAEEKDADVTLTEAAYNSINFEAAEGADQDEEK